MRNRLPQSGGEGELQGPERYYEAHYMDPRILTNRMDPGFEQGIDRVLREGEALLPRVSQWIVEQMEQGRNFQFPGPRLPHDNVVYGRVLEAARDPRNIHIGPRGAIEVVVLNHDAPLDMPDPVVQLGEHGGQLLSLDKALAQRTVVKMGNQYYENGSYREVTPFYRSRPVYMPLALYTGETGPAAHLHPTLDDVSTLSPEQRAVLMRYGQALFEISHINGLSSQANSNYMEYVRSSRENMQRLLQQLPPETPDVAA